MTRTLYHFTTRDCVLPIKQQGLLPSLDMTFAPADPVVWLTEQPDVTLDPAAGDVFAQAWGHYEASLADLEQARAGSVEMTLDGMRQWKYGKQGQRLTFEAQSRDVVIPLSAHSLVVALFGPDSS
jgi:hypothetical protein